VGQQREVVARNEHLRRRSATGGFGQRVSRVSTPWATRAGTITGPNVVIEVLPLPLAKRAPLYATAPRSSPRRCAAPRLDASRGAKTHNYLT